MKPASNSGFSLIETVAAVALFALAGFAISQACYNMLAPMALADKDCAKDANIEMCLAEISKVSDYEALDDGLDVDCPDNQRYRVYAEFAPTPVLDLFELDVKILSPKEEYRRKLLVVRPNWYENASDRDDLKEDRSDYLEQKRREDAFQKSR